MINNAARLKSLRNRVIDEKNFRGNLESRQFRSDEIFPEFLKINDQPDLEAHEDVICF